MEVRQTELSTEGSTDDDEEGSKGDEERRTTTDGGNALSALIGIIGTNTNFYYSHY